MTQKEIHAQEKEPALFEEKKEPPKKGRMKIFILVLAVLLGALFWPKPVIKGEAILQAERFARIGLSSPGMLKELLHQTGKGRVLEEGGRVSQPFRAILHQLSRLQFCDRRELAFRFCAKVLLIVLIRKVTACKDACRQTKEDEKEDYSSPILAIRRTFH